MTFLPPLCPLILLFADDTKCSKHIQSSSDSACLQNSINHIAAWSKLWNIPFNENKFVHLRFLPHLTSIPPSTYCINDAVIPELVQHKDLGIIVSSDLSFSSHHQYIIIKAYKTLGILRRSFKFASTQAKKKLHISLVKCIFTYCSQIWHPLLLSDIIALEKVQRCATKFVLNDFSSDYKPHLLALHLLPLMYHLEVNDIMFFVNSLQNPTTSFNIRQYISFSSSVTRSSTNHKLLHSLSLTNYTRHFYFNKLPRFWNSLPTIDLTLSPSTIKVNIKMFLWNHFIHHFNPADPCTFHFKCPCCNCSF
jgi:hypothetical protein